MIKINGRTTDEVLAKIAKDYIDLELKYFNLLDKLENLCSKGLALTENLKENLTKITEKPVQNE